MLATIMCAITNRSGGRLLDILVRIFQYVVDIAALIPNSQPLNETKPSYDAPIKDWPIRPSRQEKLQVDLHLQLTQSLLQITKCKQICRSSPHVFETKTRP